jgi:O-antigen ligase
LLVVLMVAVAWSSLWAPSPPIALRGAIEWLVHGCVALAMLHLLSTREGRPDRQLHLFVELAPWVAIVVGMACLTLVYRIGLDSGYPFGTEIPGFAHLRHTGYLFAPAMVLSIAQLAARPRRWWPAMPALALNAALCLWFGSRGPFFGVGCGLVAAFLLFPDFRRPALIARVGGATAAGAALSVAIPSPPNAGFNAIMRLFESSTDPTAFTSGRLTFWKETAAHVLEKPLFGHGAGQFQHIVPIAGDMYRHPHNFVLQVIFDWGFAGGGAFLVLVSLALAAALRRTHLGATHGQLAIFGAVSMLAFALVDGILFYPYPILITVFFLILPLRRAERAATGAPPPLSLVRT